MAHGQHVVGAVLGQHITKNMLQDAENPTPVLFLDFPANSYVKKSKSLFHNRFPPSPPAHVEFQKALGIAKSVGTSEADRQL